MNKEISIWEKFIWVSERVKDKKFNLINFSKIHLLIEILKIQKNIIEGNKLKAFLAILKRPIDVLKIKFLD